MGYIIEITDKMNNCAASHPLEFPQIPIFFSTFSGCFLKKSWATNSLIESRSLGFFCKQANRKFLAYGEICT